jgi:hypothetical protein
MISETFGPQPMADVSAYIHSLREALAGYAAWARESVAAVAGYVRRRHNPKYPALEQFAGLNRTDGWHILDEEDLSFGCITLLHIGLPVRAGHRDYAGTREDRRHCRVYSGSQPGYLNAHELVTSPWCFYLSVQLPLPRMGAGKGNKIT